VRHVGAIAKRAVALLDCFNEKLVARTVLMHTHPPWLVKRVSIGQYMPSLSTVNDVCILPAKVHLCYNCPYAVTKPNEKGAG
jgi:hypothetical protein